MCAHIKPAHVAQTCECRTFALLAIFLLYSPPSNFLLKLINNETSKVWIELTLIAIVPQICGYVEFNVTKFGIVFVKNKQNVLKMSKISHTICNL